MSIDIVHYYGFYRAKVLENKDPERFGKIKVWVPDLMPEIIPSSHPKTQTLAIDSSNTDNDASGDTVTIDKGLWAYPANNPVGGRSDIEDEDQWGQGTCYIPKVGTYVWIFFEGGNINHPWYFSSTELETSHVLPENQVGENYQDKWTIFKSSQGRTIVVSDDCDERIEITGKKRKLKKTKEHPEGDTESIYEILENQTTIVLEETEGEEKLLVKTWKGDFINIDISNQELHCYFKNNICIKTDADLYIESQNIHVTTNDSFYLNSSKEINIKSTEDMYISTDTKLNIKAEEHLLLYGGEFVSVLAESDLFLTGYEVIHQYTSLNLIGGDVNVGLVVPRKANAAEASISGTAGVAGIAKLYGDRATHATIDHCSISKRPEDIKPSDSVDAKPPGLKDSPSDAEDTGSTGLDKYLIPPGVSPNDIFDQTYVA